MKELYGKINYFVTSFVSILGFTLIYEVFAEDDREDKLDDALMVVLGVAAIWWYRKAGYKGESVVPAIIISGLAVLTKIMAVAIEHADKEAVGDDIGILISLVLAFGFVVWQVLAHKKDSSNNL
jgi:hypothetical protein